MKNTAIGYDQIKEILNNQTDNRTKALIAFQYVSACRIGELLEYKHKFLDKESSYTHGLMKNNIYVSENKIEWDIPNFKVKNDKKNIKHPFVLKEETLLYSIIKDWIETCKEQVFQIKQAQARNILRKALKPFSSHALRHSRATHLAGWGYGAYDIMQYLGHTNIQSGVEYVSTANMQNKLREALKRVDSNGI